MKTTCLWSSVIWIWRLLTEFWSWWTFGPFLLDLCKILILSFHIALVFYSYNLVLVPLSQRYFTTGVSDITWTTFPRRNMFCLWCRPWYWISKIRVNYGSITAYCLSDSSNQPPNVTLIIGFLIRKLHLLTSSAPVLLCSSDQELVGFLNCPPNVHYDPF